MEFLKTNWGILLQALIAVFTLIAMYHIYRKGKCAEEEKEEKKFREDITQKVAKVEASLDLLTKLYPQLKSLEKLENFEKLQLSPEDIKKTVSEVLKTTDITPEAIDKRIEEKLKKGLSKIDESTATITANILNEIDKRFKKPVARASDYLSLGNVEYWRANYSKAIELFEKAIKLDPSLAIAWSNKGVALVKLNRREEARKAHEKAIELEPKYANAWFNRACTYSLEGEKKNALSDLKMAIDLDISYKREAKKDEDFKNLWDDPNFKKLVE
jgi:tetratricopeptide (TPR) repeat protein